jgi:hypothetical protein
VTASLSSPGVVFGQALRGLLGALTGASIGALLSGWLDARMAAAASGAAGLTLAGLGLVAPLALPLGLLLWLLRLLLLGGQAWSPVQFWSFLEAQRGPCASPGW